MWKVMIVDDEQTARLGLERIISETMPELIVTTKAENGMDALEKSKSDSRISSYLTSACLSWTALN